MSDRGEFECIPFVFGLNLLFGTDQTDTRVPGGSDAAFRLVRDEGVSGFAMKLYLGRLYPPVGPVTS